LRGEVAGSPGPWEAVVPRGTFQITSLFSLSLSLTPSLSLSLTHAHLDSRRESACLRTPLSLSLSRSLSLSLPPSLPPSISLSLHLSLSLPTPPPSLVPPPSLSSSEAMIQLPDYRGTSLVRNSAPLGPYSTTVPRALRGLPFLMSEVPLYEPARPVWRSERQLVILKLAVNGTQSKWQTLKAPL